jgi:hypothetical protein
MKLEIQEVFFLKEAMKSVNIKASDAPSVSQLISKLDTEFSRLQKLQETKS